MSTENGPRLIVAGTDYSRSSDLALERAFEIASPTNAEVHVVCVVQPPLGPYAALGSFSSSESYEMLTKYTQRELEGFVTKHPDLQPPTRVVCHVRLEEPAHEIAQLAADLEADLIVVGTHGRRGAERVLLGSVAELVVRLAPCPVLVVRPKAIPAPVPKIEPPCARCLETRRISQGKQYWCDQHQERHGQRHTYHQGDRASASSNFPLVYKP